MSSGYEHIDVLSFTADTYLPPRKSTYVDLSVTRRMSIDLVLELKKLAAEVSDELEKAHQLNMRQTPDFHTAGKHVDNIWRLCDYAEQALRGT
jgi:hypothetical protein